MPVLAFYRRLLCRFHPRKAALYCVPVKSFPLCSQLLGASLVSLNGHSSSFESAYSHIRQGSTGSKPRRRSTNRKEIRKDLPPISNIYDIFNDLVENSQRHTPKSERTPFRDVLEELGGRKLRVATVCSGSESPLIALQMISESGESFPSRNTGC